MHWHTVNYRAQDRNDVRGALVNRGFWWHLPRNPVICRVRGHVPVVDGTTGHGDHRWVCCDRCGIRPRPQGVLDPAAWDIGDRFTLGTEAGVDRLPGSWPAADDATIGGQLIIGGRVTAGLSVKVGNAGSEHVLAANACVPFIGGLYLHTEGFGTWLQRRLNPVGYDSRVTEVHLHDGRLYWKVWAKRDGSDRGTPRWRDGHARVDPRDILLGERRYTYDEGNEPVPSLVSMPDGTEHAIRMQLKRQVHGRKHGRKTGSWIVGCDSLEGIPIRSDGNFHGDTLGGWSVEVSDRAVAAGAWLDEAAAATVVKVTGLRIRYGYRAPSADGEPADGAETGPDRVTAAVRRSRGGPPPATVQGFA